MPVIRESFAHLIKAFFVKRILFLIFIMLFYITVVAWLLSLTKLWDIGQFKNTVLWCLTVATVMLFRANSISENKHFFRSAALDNLKIIIILEFIINVHSLNIWLELILVPLSTFLVLLVAVAELEEKHKLVATIFNGVLMLLGTTLIIYAIYKISTDFTSFATFENLQSFVLPPIFSIAYLPFIYFIALLMAYEVLFVRYGFFTDNQKILNYSKKITLQIININLYSLKQWSHFIAYPHFKNKDSIREALREFKAAT